MRVKNRAKKARLQRIAKYLREINEQNDRQTRRSLRLQVKNDNAEGYIYNVCLFGEAGFWGDKQTKTSPPPDGYRIYVDNPHPGIEDNASTWSS
jgi:hypothetical protein